MLSIRLEILRFSELAMKQRFRTILAILEMTDRLGDEGHFIIDDV